MANNSEINALVQLLDDDDHEVFKHVHDKLKSYGAEIIPALEQQVWSAELTPATHERLEEIIHEIQFDSLLTDWQNWLVSETPDLLTGAFLLARYHYPELKFEEIQKKVMKLKQGIWLELNYNQTPLEQVQIFNQVFYSYHGFKGTQTSDDYQDFCINQVLDSKKGSSVTVGIIYQILANELNLPVYGVPLQKHFILSFCKKTLLNFSSSENNEREVMFYINPINKGSIFSRNEIKDYLEKMGVEQDPKNFTPSDNRSIIREQINYLIELYTHQNSNDRIKELNTLLEIMQ
jgi:regulator of sirC expression with transglutaminase-like and TPR domain